jgi:hypothetical protein
MRTGFQPFLIAATSLILAGCGTVHFDAPPGQRVRLLTQDDPTEVRVEHKIWYAWWGGKVMNGNHTAPFIAANQLVEVKMFTELSVGDNLINPFTSIFSFSRRTLVIEGNRRKEPAP